MTSLYALGIFYLYVIVGFLVAKIAQRKLRLFALIIFLVATPFVSAYLFNSDRASLIILLVPLVFQLINISTAVKLRYLERTASRVTATGIKLSLVLVVFYALEALNIISTPNSLVLLLSFSVALGFVALFSLKSNLSKAQNNNYLADTDLPTVSVLIPARNEDMHLAECIDAVLDSDYPKLEILVLDDCSQDKSSEIIKSFAQKGVRFIQGEVPKDNWLAKNQAYEVLASNASGDWLIFMGVDVRISKKTIRVLINNLIHSNIKMAGVLPSMLTRNSFSALMPLRFYWETCIPSLVRRFPPTLSTFWVIHDESLLTCGGFGAVSQSVLPERYFARKLHSSKEYVLFRNHKEMHVGTHKSHQGQVSTSIRLLYPQLKKSLFRLLLVSTLFAFVILHYLVLIMALLNKDYSVALYSALALLPILLSHLLVSIYMGISYKLIRTFLMPVLLLQELVIVFVSMYRYEFTEVIWKGRNICYPTLKVIPKLPKI